MINSVSLDPIAALLGEWAGTLTLGSAVLRILLAVVLAAVLGCERATKRHAAGLRTFVLVCMTSAALMILDVFFMDAGGYHVPVLSAAAVAGLCLLTANTTFFSSRGQMKGITTSVGLWATGAIGFAAGAGLYTFALIAFAALLVTLSAFPAFEIYLKNRSGHFEMHLELRSGASLGNFVTTIRELGMRIDDIEANPAYQHSGLAVYTVSLSILSDELKKYKTHAEIIAAIATLEYVAYVEEIN